MNNRIKEWQESIKQRQAHIENQLEQMKLSQEIIDMEREQIVILKRLIELEPVEEDDDERLSCCCGAPENDYGLCTSCGEHTTFLTSAEMDQ